MARARKQCYFNWVAELNKAYANTVPHPSSTLNFISPNEKKCQKLRTNEKIT